MKSSLEGIARPWDENNIAKFEDYFVPWVEEENIEQIKSPDNDNKDKHIPESSSDDRR